MPPVMETAPTPAPEADAPPDLAGMRQAIIAPLGQRSIVFIGMMGAGKTSVGRRVALSLGLPFADADAAIEEAAGMSIPEMFKLHGEQSFRDGERRVIQRLLNTPRQVIATGGGAYMNADTRAAIAARGVSVWLTAEFDLLIKRVRRRVNRPLLQSADPETVLRRLIDERYPTYALADLTVRSSDVPQDVMGQTVIAALAEYFAAVQPPAASACGA